MTLAQATAWNIYAARVEALIKGQYHDFGAGIPTASFTVMPPTAEHVAIVQGALDTATREAKLSVLHEALNPLMNALNAIDNSRTKSAIVKECRTAIETGYDSLHALKNSIELAKAEGVTT